MLQMIIGVSFNWPSLFSVSKWKRAAANQGCWHIKFLHLGLLLVGWSPIISLSFSLLKMGQTAKVTQIPFLGQRPVKTDSKSCPESMKYFNVKPLFLIAVRRPLSNISISCPARFAAQDFPGGSNNPGPPPAAKSRLQIFLDVGHKRASASVNVFLFFSGFRGIFYIFIWISWSSVILWSQAFGGRTFQTSKREKFRQEQRQNILQTCLLSDLCFYCCWLVLANRLRP